VEGLPNWAIPKTDKTRRAHYGLALRGHQSLNRKFSARGRLIMSVPNIKADRPIFRRDKRSATQLNQPTRFKKPRELSMVFRKSIDLVASNMTILPQFQPPQKYGVPSNHYCVKPLTYLPWAKALVTGDRPVGGAA
jgi:hypothetical protein